MKQKLFLFLAIILITIQSASANLYYVDITPQDGYRPYHFNATLHNGTGANTVTDLYLNNHNGTNFADVYFTLPNNTILNHFVEDNATGKTWINLTSNGTFRMWYGDTTHTSTSNGSKTFPAFCCDTPTLNTSTWASTGTPTISGNVLTLNAVGEQISTYQTYPSGYALQANITAAVTTGSLRMAFDTCATCIDWNPSTDGNKYAETRNGATTILNDGAYTTSEAIYSFNWFDSTRVNFFYNRILSQTSTTNIPPGPYDVLIISETATTYNLNKIFLRNISYPELQISSVTIENQVNYIPIVASDTVQYPNDASQGISSLVPVKVKQTNITESYNGSWKINFSLYEGSVTSPVHGQIYKNDIPYGTLQTTSSIGYNTFSQTFTNVNTISGDSYSVYAYSDAAFPGEQIAFYRIQFDYDYANSSIIPIYPTNSSSVNFNYPPQYSDVNFTWSQIGNSGYEILIAKDNNFNLIVVDTTTLNPYYIQSLESGVFYWKVRTYNDAGATLGNWSTTFSFTMIPSTSGVVNNSASGIVYQIVNNQIVVISGAKVEIYNSTFYNYMLTGSNGYYLFTGLSNLSTYTLKASLVDEFDDSPSIPVSPANNTSIVTNILMQKCTTSFTCGLKKQFITFAVQNLYFTRYQNVDVNVYKTGEASILTSGITNTAGEVTFYLTRDISYTFTFINATQGISVTWVGTISSSGYQYIITSSSTSGDFTNNTDALATINTNISTYIINANTAMIFANYTDTLNETSDLTFYLNQTIPGDPNNQTNLAIVNGSNNGTFSANFTITSYSGQGYIVNIKLNHTTLGNDIKYSYAVQFPAVSPLSAFDPVAILMLVVGLVMFFAGMFGQTSTEQGAAVIVGLVWLLDGAGLMVNLNLGTGFHLGLTLATVIAILMNVNARSRREGLQ